MDKNVQPKKCKDFTLLLLFVGSQIHSSKPLGFLENIYVDFNFKKKIPPTPSYTGNSCDIIMYTFSNITVQIQTCYKLIKFIHVDYTIMFLVLIYLL